MNSSQNDQFNNLLKSLSDAGEKNTSEKRKNFEHLTLLIGTILGFSAGLMATSSGQPNCLLIASWVVDVLSLIIGSSYLVIEAESRYYRTFLVAEKQLELAKMTTEAELKNAARSLLADAQKVLFDVSTARNTREKVFIIFAKYQHQFEAVFYTGFILSLILLVASFF